MSSNSVINEKTNSNLNYSYNDVTNKNTGVENNSTNFSVEEKTDKSSNKKWYIIIAIIFIILIFIS